MAERGYWDKILNRRMTRRRTITAAGALTASAAFLAACGGDDDDDGGSSDGGSGSSSGGSSGGGGGAASGDPKSGGVVRMNPVTPNDPAHFDLHQAADATISWLMTLYYNQLVRFSEQENGRIDPDLATSWESPDELTLTFALNEANFHDGTPFTSEDVKVTMERIMNPPEGVVSTRQQQFLSVDNVETPDDRTVVFHLGSPSASFLGVLGQINIGIYAAKDILADPVWHMTNVNGTGPFKPDRIDQGSLYTAVRNDDYFVEGLPYLDGAEWHIIPEEVAEFAAFQAGNLDLIDTPIVNIPDVEGMSNATVLKTAGTAFWRTTVATFKEPWTDERTWKAIALAVNRQDFNLAAYQGQSLIGAMGVPAGSSWSLTHDELLQIPGYAGLGDGQESDMEARWAEAKKLLSAASIEDGRAIDLFGRDGSSAFQTHAEVVADGLRNAGLNPSIGLYERGTYDERLTAGDFGDIAANSGSATFPDPTPVYADSYADGGARNYQRVVVPAADDLWRQQEAELDPARRDEIQREMQKTYLAKYPLATHAFTVTIQSFYNYVKDYGPLYGAFYQGRKFDRLWLDK
jgi:peptide/nickel transport system substrate-binding protein